MGRASEHPQRGVDFFDSVDPAQKLNRDILLQFSVDAASDAHDSVQGIDVKLASVERSLPSQAALGKTDDIDIINGLGHIDEIGDSLITKIRCHNTSVLGLSSV